MTRTTRRLAMTALLCTLTLTGCGGGGEDTAGTPAASPTPKAPRLQAAFDVCRRGSDPDKTLSVADQGRSVIIDTGSEYGDQGGMDCLLDKVGTPQSILAALGATTALQGVQDAEHDGLNYSWSYHPKNGVNMVIEDTQ